MLSTPLDNCSEGVQLVDSEVGISAKAGTMNQTLRKLVGSNCAATSRLSL
jgi:hypothetical protein